MAHLLSSSDPLSTPPSLLPALPSNRLNFFVQTPASGCYSSCSPSSPTTATCQPLESLQIPTAICSRRDRPTDCRAPPPSRSHRGRSGLQGWHHPLTPLSPPLTPLTPLSPPPSTRVKSLIHCAPHLLFLDSARRGSASCSKCKASFHLAHIRPLIFSSRLVLAVSKMRHNLLTGF